MVHLIVGILSKDARDILVMLYASSVSWGNTRSIVGIQGITSQRKEILRLEVAHFVCSVLLSEG